jgi:hypothetical protein
LLIKVFVRLGNLLQGNPSTNRKRCGKAKVNPVRQPRKNNPDITLSFSVTSHISKENQDLKWMIIRHRCWFPVEKTVVLPATADFNTNTGIIEVLLVIVINLRYNTFL